MSKLDLGLPGYQSMFESTEKADSEQTETFQNIEIDTISDFKDHPFHINMDEDMVKLIESIEVNGQLMPVLVRPSKNGYEMISGHRRKYAMQKLGYQKVKAIVKNLNDDEATILMVDSNIQREHISMMEKAFAYKMRLEAMKHQGKAMMIDETCAQVEYKSKGKKSIEILAEMVGVNRNQIQRYIRLTHLIEPLQQMVDGVHPDGYKMAFNPAVEISFLTKEEQYDLLACIEELVATPSLVQAQRFKAASKEGTLSIDYIRGALSVEKPNQSERSYVKWSKYDKYFPKSYTNEQKDRVVEELLTSWARKRQKENVR
ncbi:ParB/RepB/Spo0J family partition protein [[Clostridium] innocuum]|uniref:ParB/RepB/Spo0J family partition protein n=1 Tax=Clostridium innocuum TaxID=1522 RepID=UPI001C393932|nr:ParB/RepB/Spo0J family partition protein [[Clostridium] innocuum]MBV4171322.1 ParB/RepB/Spo0J family partition protein [[Clostridium] innocuum]